MRIAIPLTEGKLALHLNRCQEFALIDVDPNTGIVQGRRWAAAPSPGRGVVPEWLAGLGAQMVIAGHLGRREQSRFAEQGIRTLVDAPAATAGQLVAAYVAGSLRTREGLGNA